MSLAPRCSASARRDLRKASSSVMSASSNWVTCGTFSQLRCILAAVILSILPRSTTSTGPKAAKSTSGIDGRPAPGAACCAASAFCTKACRSSLRMRPRGPRPRTSASGTPNSRARRRTPGPAYTPLSRPARGGAAVPEGAGAGGFAGSAGSAAACCAAEATSAGGWGWGGAASRGGAACGDGEPALSVSLSSAGSPASSSAVATTATGAPSFSIAPSAASTATTVPATVEGISMDALSDSRTISPCSRATVSPGATRTSTTSAASDPPISGTTTVCSATGSLLLCAHRPRFKRWWGRPWRR